MNDTIDNTDSLIKRYSETVRRIHTVLSQLTHHPIKGILTSICITYVKSMILQLQCNIAFQSTKEEPLYNVPHWGIYRFKRRPYGFPTLQLPDGLASLRPLSNMRPAT